MPGVQTMKKEAKSVPTLPSGQDQSMRSKSFSHDLHVGKEVAVGSIPTGSIHNILKSCNKYIQHRNTNFWRSALKCAEWRRVAQDGVTKSVPMFSGCSHVR